MSGVRNLRAMFEQKGDALPDRGRSPVSGGLASPSPGASPRPLGTVRTAFVAIEKDGRMGLMGLKRETSRDSANVSVSSRRLSDDTDVTTPQPVSERTDIFSDNMAGGQSKTKLSYEAIPESPAQDTPVQLSPKKTPPKVPPKPEALASPQASAQASPTTSPNANPDKITDEEEPETKMLPSNPTESSALQLGDASNASSDESVKSGSVTTTTKAQRATKLAPKTVAPVSTAKTATKAPKSPMPAKAAGGKESTKIPTTTSNTRKPASAKTTASKPASIDVPSSGAGFVKSKSKSPTRPVKLPSSLTTHTAASAQKFGSGDAAPASRTLSRASGSAQHLSVNPTPHRSSSRNSVLGPAATVTRTLKHKPSSANVGRARPSLGPPPKSGAKEQPAVKKESHVDESFLARMMRPTQSSAKKTSEKVPVTPPRNQVAPKKVNTKEVEKNAKKLTSKIQGSSTQTKTPKADAKSVTAKTDRTAKDVAPVVAQAETAEAAIEEAQLLADTAGHETQLPSPSAAVSIDVSTTQESEIPSAQAVAKSAVDAETDATEPTPPVSAASEDQLHVEDIEDAVQEVREPSHEPQPPESVAEGSVVSGVEVAEGSLNPEDSGVEIESTTTTEFSKSIDIPEHDTNAVHVVEDPTFKDAAATAH